MVREWGPSAWTRPAATVKTLGATCPWRSGRRAARRFLRAPGPSGCRLRHREVTRSYTGTTGTQRALRAVTPAEIGRSQGAESTQVSSRRSHGALARRPLLQGSVDGRGTKGTSQRPAPHNSCEGASGHRRGAPRPAKGLSLGPSFQGRSASAPAPCLTGRRPRVRVPGTAARLVPGFCSARLAHTARPPEGQRRHGASFRIHVHCSVVPCWPPLSAQPGSPGLFSAGQTGR